MSKYPSSITEDRWPNISNADLIRDLTETLEEIPHGERAIAALKELDQNPLVSSHQKAGYRLQWQTGETINDSRREFCRFLWKLLVFRGAADQTEDHVALGVRVEAL